MTVQELHVKVNQRYQEVASNKRDTFFPEEIDLALNTAQDRFILENIDQKNYEPLQPLIVRGYNNFTRQRLSSSEETASFGVEENTSYIIIPPSLLHPLNARAHVITSTTDCSSVPASITYTTASIYKYAITMPEAGPPYFQTLSIQSSTHGNLFTMPTAYSAGFSNKTAVYRVVRTMADQWWFEEIQNTSNRYYYWEKFDTFYHKGSFVLISGQNLGNISVLTNSITRSIHTPTTISISLPNPNTWYIDPADDVRMEIKPMEFVEPSMVDERLSNRYYRTHKDKPWITRHGEKMTVYSGESFLVAMVTLDYIRKPRAINLALNQSCELLGAINEIVDLAVEILRLDTKDPNYPQTVQDTELRNKT